MAWWNDLLNWFTSTTGLRVFYGAILPFLAIVVAGVIAALVGRGAARGVLDHVDRELKAAAITALIVVGRRASIWTSLGADEKQHVDGLMSEAEIRVRLLPMSGSNTAADWAAHELATMKKNSASFSFQAEQSFVDYRDRLLNWQAHPGRARKLFTADLDQWKYQDVETASPLVSEQQEWATAHVTPPVGPPVAGLGAPTAPAYPASAFLAEPDAPSAGAQETPTPDGPAVRLDD